MVQENDTQSFYSY